jgi:enterochelin esterase-like enzyme
MPKPKSASLWLTCSLNCLPALLFAVFSGTNLLAVDLPRLESSDVMSGDELRPIRSSDSPAGQLLAVRLGAAATATVPAGPPPGQRPSTPKPGPCPLPILPALAAMEDTTFFTVRDVPHGNVEAVNYTNHLGTQKRMHIYLPPGYDQDTTRRHPVLYLNHGGGDDDAKWTNTDPRSGGHAHTILDNLIADGKARPMIIVMPNTRGLAAANPPPEDEDDACTQEYLKDIIPYVDRHFRTQASREGRALAGLSMGGFVVMHTGLSRLDTFSELYVYSSGHFPDGLPKFEDRFRALFEDAETNNKLRVPFYMAQGETDIALRNGQRVMAIIHQYGLRNFWVLSSGGHEWANWRRYLHQTAQIMFPDCD